MMRVTGPTLLLGVDRSLFKAAALRLIWARSSLTPGGVLARADATKEARTKALNFIVKT